jgi:hypothetical protein
LPSILHPVLSAISSLHKEQISIHLGKTKMDEKEVGYDSSEKADLPDWVRWYDSRQPGYRHQWCRRVLIAGCLILMLLMILRPSRSNILSEKGFSTPMDIPDERVVTSSTANPTKKVPLEAHIMSKCPDARDCLQKLVVPAMEQIHDKVDFKLSYIGRYVNCPGQEYATDMTPSLATQTPLTPLNANTALQNASET